jgi:hypothetical protein
MVSLLRLFNTMAFLSDNFRYSVFKNGSNVEIFIKNSSTFENVGIAYVFAMGFLSYLIYSHDFSCISSNITLDTWIGNKWNSQQLGRKHFPNAANCKFQGIINIRDMSSHRDVAKSSTMFKRYVFLLMRFSIYLPHFKKINHDYIRSVFVSKLGFV